MISSKHELKSNTLANWYLFNACTMCRGLVFFSDAHMSTIALQNRIEKFARILNFFAPLILI